MKRLAYLCLIVLTYPNLTELHAQQSLDKSLVFPPGSGTTRKYSIYVPSSYNANNPARLMVGFHPFNVSTWYAVTWRDTLASFAEANGLLLICPDGGPNGRTDDADDYTLTLALMDSMLLWYNVDETKIFAIGFSVGGKAVYEFCLQNNQRFKGAIPIGAAVNGTTSFSTLLPKAKCLNFYLVHGDKDAPNTRYYPVKTALEQNNANVSALLMGGIGHTIDFPSRNTILKNALKYVDTVSCDFTGIIEKQKNDFAIFPNPASKDHTVLITTDMRNPRINIIDLSGRSVIDPEIRTAKRNSYSFSTGGMAPGMYLLRLISEEGSSTERFVIH